ncbi:MAG: hypothetical protein AAB842_03165 [Patescibacteria group bacterium]
MKKTIVVFSNPFGYGPTGIALPVLKSFLNKLGALGVNIIFAGSDLCMEIASEMPIQFIHLDDRNEVEIEKCLKEIECPHVIGSQNRFCIKVAKRMNIPCAFIDVLAWFWKEIPVDHLLADEIFWINFPQIQKKIPLGRKNIHIVSSIITTIPSSGIKKQKQLIIHIGGAKYPLMGTLPYNYLDLISIGINNLPKKSFFNRVLCAGGSEAIAYLRKKVVNKDVLLVSLPKDKFIEELEKSSYIITTAGVSSTLESFALNVPVSFLLPLNLSHIALKDVFEQQGVFIKSLSWKNYVNTIGNLRDSNERDALVEIDKYAKLVSSNDKKRAHFVKDFIKITQSIPDSTKQRKVIEYMGDSGADEIVDILSNSWNLN